MPFFEESSTNSKQYGVVKYMTGNSMKYSTLKTLNYQKPDQHPVSPKNINNLANREVFRMKEIASEGTMFL